jgi:hypothetical protein
MKKIIFTLFSLSTILFSNSQNVGINNANLAPDPSAGLDVNYTDKGLLIPRVSLTGTNDVTTVPGAATSLLVYNTVTVSDVTPGYYFWDGTQWVRLLSGTLPPASADWTLTGNAGTTAGANFLGTTDAQDLVFKTNNTEYMRILTTGEVGINTPAPVLSLQVNATDAFGMPAGTTAQQPASPPTGATRYNTTAGMMEVFTGTCWMYVNTPPIGATYIQWAGAADPNTIYPCTQWVATDMQNGEFIRAVGGNANVSASGSLTGTVQNDAVENHQHSATATVNNSSTLTTSSDGSHNHGAQTGNVASYNTSMWIPYDDNLSSSTVNETSNTPSTCGQTWNGEGTVGNFMGQMNSACLNHTHTISTDGSHTHTVPAHNHTATVNVGNMSTGTADTETRPVNVAVKFWRRIN